VPVPVANTAVLLEMYKPIASIEAVATADKSKPILACFY